MSETLRSKQVKIRKPHDCWGCDQEYPKGTSMMCLVGVDDKIYTIYWCDVCLAFMDKYLDRFEQEEGIMFGELRWGYDDVYTRFKEEYVQGKNSSTST